MVEKAESGKNYLYSVVSSPGGSLWPVWILGPAKLGNCLSEVNLWFGHRHRRRHYRTSCLGGVGFVGEESGEGIKEIILNTHRRNHRCSLISRIVDHHPRTCLICTIPPQAKPLLVTRGVKESIDLGFSSCPWWEARRLRKRESTDEAAKDFVREVRGRGRVDACSEGRCEGPGALEAGEAGCAGG